MKALSTTSTSKILVRVAILTGLILLIPLVAMQFTSEVDWNLGDFIIIGVLIFGTGLALDLVARRVNKKYRIWALLAIIAIFMLIWAELAVGVFGSPFAGS